MSIFRDAAAALIAEGLAVVPLLPSKDGKSGLPKDWTKRTFTVEDFDAATGVGVRPGELAIVDVDHRALTPFAKLVLPTTHRIDGRPAKEPGHFFYLAPGVPRYQFKDVKRPDPDRPGHFRTDVLVETNPGYAVVPPSPSTTGQPRYYVVNGPIDPAEADAVFAAARTLAAGGLLGLHWPRGNRHYAVLAAAGFLIRHVDADTVETIVTMACNIANDEEPEDRRTALRDTISKAQDADEKITGGPTLESLVGADVMQRLRTWFVRKTDDFALNEEGDAQAFAARYGDRVRFFHRSKSWLMAEEASGIWVPDTSEQIIRYASDLMVELYKKAQTKEARAWAHAGHSRKRITNTIALAQSIAPLSVPATDNGWDDQPFLLGVPNGVVDLRTGELRRALPEEQITMRARVAYDPDATCPLFERTILEIFTFDAPDDAVNGGLSFTESPRDRAESLVAFIQRAIGYTLTGDVREECFFLLWGKGRNGKGTLVNLFYWLLGDYADNLSMAALEAHAFENTGPRPDIAKLPGRRMVTASENKKTSTLNAELIKRLTGRDPVTVRQLYKPEFTFDPVFKLWMMVNNKPEGIREDDVAMWARIHLIPFLRSFDGCADTTLKDRLREEAAGVLAWAVRGAMAWRREGLNPPDVVRAATQQYRAESDTLLQFVDECCVRAPRACTKSGDLLRAYQQWCSNRNERPEFNHKTFASALVARGFPVDPNRPKAFTWIAGLGLLEESPRRDPGV